MTVAGHPPPTRKPDSFDVTQHQVVVRPMPSGTQAIPPTAKGTSVEPSRGRGSVVDKRNNPCRSRYQMMLRPSDSITTETSPVKRSSAEMSCEKGPLCTSERKSPNKPLAMARRAPVQEESTIARATARAIETKQACKSSWRADPHHEGSTEPDSPVRDWKRVLRIQPRRNPSRLDACQFAL
ncbi:hypothetical protein AAC387_Pa03g1669 [Persea americana]